MERFKTLTCYVFLVFLAFESKAQNVDIEELKAVIARENEDTLTVVALNDLAFAYRSIDPDTTLLLSRQALQMANRLNYQPGRAISHFTIGVGYHILGEYDTALHIYNQGMELADQLNDIHTKSRLLNNIGLIHWNRGDHPKALEQFQQTLQIDQEVNNVNGQATALNNIGLIYRDIGDAQNALRFFHQSEQILTSLGDEFRLSQLLNNIGLIQSDLENYEDALHYYQRSLWYSTSAGAVCHRAYPLAGIALVHAELDRADSAIFYGNQVLNIEKECQQPKLNAQSYLVIGRSYQNKGRIDLAETNLLSGLTIAESLGLKRTIKSCAEHLYLVHKRKGDFRSALRYHEKYSAMNDSLFNENKLKELSKLETQYELEQQRRQLLGEQEKAQLVLEQQIERERLVRNSGMAGFILVLLLAITYYRSYRRKKKAHELLEGKNQLITEQNSSIKKQSEELKAINEKLTELSQFKEGLTQMIAHDMKNPLHVIISLAEGKMDEDKLKIIGQSGQEMLNLVTNMLDVQKFEETEIELKDDSIILSKLLDEVRLQTDLLLVSKSLRLEVNLSHDFRLKGDTGLLVRVLVNLITNAVKFSSVGGTIQINATTSPDNNIRIEVRDFS